MVTLKKEFKTSCRWVEVDLTLNTINNQKMQSTTDIQGVTTTYDIDLSKPYTVEYACNTSVFERVKHVEEFILGFSRSYTETELQLVPSKGAKYGHNPFIVLKDELDILVLEFDFLSNHWALVPTANAQKCLQKLNIPYLVSFG
jgi:hypothetical protein